MVEVGGKEGLGDEEGEGRDRAFSHVQTCNSRFLMKIEFNWVTLLPLQSQLLKERNEQQRQAQEEKQQKKESGRIKRRKRWHWIGV